jgi:hypothetical protein
MPEVQTKRRGSDARTSTESAPFSKELRHAKALLCLAIGVIMNATARNNSWYHSVAGKARAMSKL